MKKDVFISYASEDRSVAEKICSGLEADGISCWIAPRNILAGDSYAEAIIRGVDETEILVLVFSGHANNSPHIIREVERGVHNKAVIVPFIIEKVKPDPSFEYFISAPQWLDATTPRMEDHIRELVETVKAQLTRRKLAKTPVLQEQLPVHLPPLTQKSVFSGKIPFYWISAGILIVAIVAGVILYPYIMPMPEPNGGSTEPLQQIGNLYGMKSPGSTGIDRIQFRITGTPGKQPVDLQKLTIKLTYGSVLTTIDQNHLIITASDGSQILSANNQATIEITLHDPIPPSTEFHIEIIPGVGESLNIQRTTAETLEGTNIF